jgi:hypothetical protein
MSASPWDDVAVNVLTPVNEAAMQEAMAECSDSVRIMIPLRMPEASHSESFS